MAITQVMLSFNDMNISAQVGDIIYYSFNATPVGGFNHTHLHNTKKLGPIIEIDGSSITVEYDNSIVAPPPSDSFISFVKDKRVNTTSLLGYYAKVKFVNDSTDKIELFSVGSEISQSSE